MSDEFVGMIYQLTLIGTAGALRLCLQKMLKLTTSQTQMFFE